MFSETRSTSHKLSCCCCCFYFVGRLCSNIASDVFIQWNCGNWWKRECEWRYSERQRETDGQMKRNRCEWKENEAQSRGAGLNQDSRQQSDPPRHTADICKAPASGCLWSKHTHTHTHTLKTLNFSHTLHLHPHCPRHPTPSLGGSGAGWLLPSRVESTDLNDLLK